jgi:multidrug efflux system membrane fusion protein
MLSARGARTMRPRALYRSILALSVLTAGGFAVRAYLNREARAAPGKEAQGEGRVVPVVVVPVVAKDMPVYLDGLGNVVASATVTVRAQVSGRLDDVLFKEGQEVHKGDVLAQIDPRPFRIQLHQADASLARDRAQLEGARRNLDRFTALGKDGLSSKQQIDDQRTLVAQLEATTRADQAQIESAQLSLDFARVTSPIDGVTGVRLVDRGNVVSPSDPNGMVVITQLDPIAVVFTLPQDDLPAINKELAKGALTVDALSRDGGKKLAEGKLALVDNQINQATATIRLKAMFPNPDRVLWPNAFVKARLLLTTKKDALVVPSAVVQRGPQGTFAYVIGPDQKASVRPIQVEAAQGELSILASGLKAGEEVVVDGQYQLKPGAKVAARKADEKGKPEEGGPKKVDEGAKK